MIQAGVPVIPAARVTYLTEKQRHGKERVPGYPKPAGGVVKNAVVWEEPNGKATTLQG